MAWLHTMQRLTQGAEMDRKMYEGLSVSPQHGSFAPGYEPQPSDLDNLIAGRQRKLNDLVDQSVAERVLRGNVHVGLAPLAENGVGELGVGAQDTIGASLVRNRCL